MRVLFRFEIQKVIKKMNYMYSRNIFGTKLRSINGGNSIFVFSTFPIPSFHPISEKLNYSNFLLRSQQVESVIKHNFAMASIDSLFVDFALLINKFWKRSNESPLFNIVQG